jgi:hypothetical protein
VIDLSAGALPERIVSSTSQVNVRNLNEEFTVVSEKLKKAYIDDIESIPEQNENSQLLSPLNGQLSLWVLLADQFKSKSAYFDHPFNIIARAKTVAEVLSEEDIQQAVLLTTNPQERAIYTSVVESNQLRVEGAQAPTRRGVLFRFISAFLLGLLQLCREIGKSVFAKIIAWRYVSAAKETSQSVLLFSRSNQWRQYDWQKDRYYHNFPEIAEKEGLSVTYALHLTGTSPMTVMRRLSSDSSLANQVALPQARLAIRDYVTIGLSYFAATIRLGVFLLTTTDTYIIADTNAGALVTDQLLRGFKRVPYSLVQYKSLIHEFQRHDPSAVVTTHFESAIGRVVVAAAEETGYNTIGLQHGPVVAGKLQYHIRRQEENRYPMPDMIAVDGEHAADVLEDGGCPRERIDVIGGIRYESLFENTDRDHQKGTDQGDKRPIVVFFGLSDYESMAATIMPALQEQDTNVLLKPHPSAHDVTVACLQRWLEADDDHFHIVDNKAHDLIHRSAIVIASYSSTAIETLALGHRLICVPPRYRLDPTPFAGTDIPKMRSTNTLQEELARARAQESDYNEFIERFFGPQDGRAAYRLAALSKRVSHQSGQQ